MQNQFVLPMPCMIPPCPKFILSILTLRHLEGDLQRMYYYFRNSPYPSFFSEFRVSNTFFCRVTSRKLRFCIFVLSVHGSIGIMEGWWEEKAKKPQQTLHLQSQITLLYFRISSVDYFSVVIYQCTEIHGTQLSNSGSNFRTPPF